MNNDKITVLEKEENIAIITLNRPQKLNTFCKRHYRELANLLDELEKDDSVRVVIITGAPKADGTPCFSAGTDVKEAKELGMTDYLGTTTEELLLESLEAVGEQRDVESRRFLQNRLESFPKPMIAAIDGICTGGGLDIAAVCDFRVASVTADIRDLHMKNFGMIAGQLQTWLPRLVGLSRAKKLLWTGERINIEEARQIGLVDEVYPPDKLMEGAKSLARNLAANSPLTMRISKAIINASLGQSASESGRFSDLCGIVLRHLASEAEAQKLTDFVEKRKAT
jgi:enoyl-CoA hydratase/carnithine racemase